MGQVIVEQALLSWGLSNAAAVNVAPGVIAVPKANLQSSNQQITLKSFQDWKATITLVDTKYECGLFTFVCLYGNLCLK